MIWLLEKLYIAIKIKQFFGENICNTLIPTKPNIFFTSTKLPSVKIGIKRSCKSPNLFCY